MWVCCACDRNKHRCIEQLLRMCVVLYVLFLFLLAPPCLPPPLSLSHSCSYFTTSKILMYVATPRQVDDCGPAIATGEEGKYQRRSRRGGDRRVEGKPNQWWSRTGLNSLRTCHLGYREKRVKACPNVVVHVLDLRKIFKNGRIQGILQLWQCY